MWQSLVLAFVSRLITPERVKLLWSWVRPLIQRWADGTANKIDDAALASLDKFFADPDILKHIAELVESLIRGKTPPPPIDPLNPPAPEPARRGILRRILSFVIRD